MRRNYRLGLVLLVATAGSLGFLTPPAEAARASSGERCTIVGTPRADLLSGTRGRDVICGLGGNDDISAKGGDDVVDAGAGRDVVSGGAGEDHLAGGRGGDTLYGDSGDDVIRGGKGRDLQFGGGGDDKLLGDKGSDILGGDKGNDRLIGRKGNDDLTGGQARDRLTGGDGTDWCTINNQDIETGCIPDTEKPVVMRAGQLSRHTVDVTDQDARVSVRLHIQDDTGVDDVQLMLGSDTAFLTLSHAYLVSGTVRDGWFEGDMVIAESASPGDFQLYLDVTDRSGKMVSEYYFDETLRVIDRDPDLERPRVALIKPTDSQTIDVTSGAKDVTIEARITDDDSGVSHSDMCLYKPLEDFYTNLQCVPAERISGNALSGIWRATVPIPEGDTSGLWNVGVYTADRAHVHTPIQWVGPEVYASLSAGGVPDIAPLAAGTGRLTVIGGAG